MAVSIEKMTVLIGRYFNFHCQCCAYYEIDVESSGVEEYLFLYKIGDLIGEKNMPKIALFNKNI